MADDNEPCTDCPDDFAAVTATDDGPDTAPDPRGTKITKWGPALLAPIGKPTGDKRRFAAGALSNRDLPLGLKWQRQDGQGHSGSVVIGTLDGVTYDDDSAPWGFGLLFNPDAEQLPRLAEDVAEARMLLEKGVIGPSVDLDDMEFHALDEKDAGQYAADQRPEIEVTRGRISAATLVPIPAFAEARALPLTEMEPDEYAAELEAHNAALTASVRSSGWSDLSVATGETAWDAAEAVARVREWASEAGGDDFEQMYAQAFLWSDGETHRFPLADVVDGELCLVPEALLAAGQVLSDGHTVLPDTDQQRMRNVLERIVDDLAGEFGFNPAEKRGAHGRWTIGGAVRALGKKLDEHATRPASDKAVARYRRRAARQDARAGGPLSKKLDHLATGMATDKQVARYRERAARQDDRELGGRKIQGAGAAFDGKRVKQVAQDVLDGKHPGVARNDLPLDVRNYLQRVKPGKNGKFSLDDDELVTALAALDDTTLEQAGTIADELADDEEDSATFGARFERLAASLQGKVSDPGAVAATIGRKKYGKKGMARLRSGVPAKQVKPVSMAASAIEEAMVAAANLNEAPDAPLPGEWFQDPKLAGPTALTVSPDGRVFGHLATWNTCHTGFPGACTVAPKSRSKYAYFHTGAVDTTAGEVAVGRISIGGGHADTRWGVQAAAEHYDSTSTQAAVVRAGEDKYGIWVSGAAVPGADLAALKRSPLSGDWRRIGGNLELVHALAVNSGGFPIPRASMVAGAQQALVAAGVVQVEEGGEPAVTAFTTGALEALVIQAVHTARRAEQNYARAMAALAAMDDAADVSVMSVRRMRALRAAKTVRTPAQAGAGG